MKRVTVFGGAGFVGGALVRRLQGMASIERITVFDRREYPWPLQERKNTICIQGDIHDSVALHAAVQDSDTVFHLAANADIAKAAIDPVVDFWGGTYLTQRILEVMRVSSAKRLFYMSGSGVYGECGDELLNENHVCQPISPYGASKLASEALISAYCAMFGLTARAFRFANIIGRGQTHGVGYDFIRALQKDPTKLRILGDGTQSKSYIHVDDALEAILHMEMRAEGGFDVFNVATENFLTVREIANLAAYVTSTKPEYEFTGGDRGWKGDVPIVRLSTLKIRGTGWRPSWTSFEAMTRALKDML